MADEDKKKFPSMPTGQWSALRRKFRNTIPREITPTYLASALGMDERSASANILPSLRETRLIDDDGKPTELAIKWRDDTQYAEVCETIRKSEYPQELLDLAPDPGVDRAAVLRWFLNHTGKGKAAANKYTAFYMLLLEADPTKEASPPSQTPRGRENPARNTPRRAQAAARPAKHGHARQSEQSPAAEPMAHTSARQQRPELHINIQLHMSPEASPEQIDQIFASMAKHLRDSP